MRFCASGRMQISAMTRMYDKHKGMEDMRNEREKKVVADQSAGMTGGLIEGRRAVTEALRAQRPINRLLMLDGAHDAPLETIRREAKKAALPVQYVTKQRLDQLSESGAHQGVIAFAAPQAYASMEDIFALAEKRGEPPFVFLLDNIEDPHNLGAIIRTANVCGAHGVIIPRNRAAQMTASVEKAAAGALSYTPLVRVTNLVQTIDALKERGLWFVCADMDGEDMHRLDLKGPVGLIIGNEGSGVAPLVRKHCDLTAAIPVRGEISSLNASVAAGVLAYEIVRQRAQG